MSLSIAPDATGCVLTITIPRRLMLTSNQRMHWAPKADRTRTIRTLARIAARGCPRFDRADLLICVTWPNRRRRDRDNLDPTLKAAIDGMTDAGILPDDSDACLISKRTTTTDPDPSVDGVRLAFLWTEAP